MKKIFLITYKLFDKSNQVIASGQFKVKNKSTEFEAKCSFEEYLKRKHTNFGRLVITKCDEENLFKSILGDINFGKTNPFNL